jgi:hypothetical protein
MSKNLLLKVAERGRKARAPESSRGSTGVQFADLRSQGVFERIEDKFFVSRERLEELNALLEKQMAPSYLDPNTRFCGVESIYLDSSNLNSYTSHFRPATSSARGGRFKIRVRRYYPDGRADHGQSALLELKQKVFDGEQAKTKKVRFSLGLRDLARLMRGKTVQFVPRLLRLNPSISPVQLFQRLRMINKLIRKHGLKPICRVSYVRRAFEASGLRVTYDDGIRYESLLRAPVMASPTVLMESEQQKRAAEMAEQFRSFDGVVLEVKHGGDVPGWLTSFLDRTGSGKISFSKYCFSITDQVLLSKGAQA